MSDSELPVTSNTEDKAPLTDAEQEAAKRGIVFVLRQLLDNPSAAPYLVKALQWGLGVLGCQVKAVSDDGLAQAAGYLLTAGMAAWAFWEHHKRDVALRAAQAQSKPLPAVSDIKPPLHVDAKPEDLP